MFHKFSLQDVTLHAGAFTILRGPLTPEFVVICHI